MLLHTFTTLHVALHRKWRHTCFSHVMHMRRHQPHTQQAIVYIYVTAQQVHPTPTNCMNTFCLVHAAKVFWGTLHWRNKTLKYSTLYTSFTTCNMQSTAYCSIPPNCIILIILHSIMHELVHYYCKFCFYLLKLVYNKWS